MPREASKREFYFGSPRLKMSVAGRFVVRFVSYLAYLVLIAAAFTFLVSDIPWIFWSGVLLALFLVDRVVHLREADYHLTELPVSGRVNLVRYLSPQSSSVIERAYDRSIFMKTDFSLEVCRQLLGVEEIKAGIRRMDVRVEEFRQKAEELLRGSAAAGSRPKEERLKEAAALVEGAFRRAYEHQHRFIHPSDLFAALPELEHALLLRLFNTFSIVGGDVDQAMLFSALIAKEARFGRFPSTLGGLIPEVERNLRHRIMNRAWTSRPTPTLDRYGTDFTDLARQNAVGLLIGHEEEYKRLTETLARSSKPNALLVGEGGVGKEALIEHLAFELTRDRVPPPLFDKRLVGLSLSRLVAGASPDELQARLKRVVDEIMIAGNVILYIPEIHNLVKTSGTAYLSAADALVPIIMNNAFPVIGSTYPREFKQLVEPRSDFTDAFEVIRVEEISEADARKLLIYESLLLERRTGVAVSFGAVKTAVRLAKKYFHNKFLPGSAEELLKSALATVQAEGGKFLGPDAVVRCAEEKVKIPIHEAGEAEALSLLGLEKRIHERLIGQDEAVKAVADAIREYRSGLARPGGPIASFLFVGPTGVGKTELSKILAKIQFGDEKAMIRFDMTEYQDKQSFYRFIGSPDGNVSGALTDAVLQKPYGVVLLDEFEKAFPDILNLFLQVFDDGRLTDNLGRTVDFTNTIIIATSNAHGDLVNEALTHGQTMAEIAEYLKRRLVEVFRPELINRFSKIIVFRDLSPQDVEKIALINLKDVAKMLEGQGIALRFDDAVVKFVAKLGYNPAFGARPLRQVIEERVKAPLAEQLLKKEIARGADVTATLEGEQVRFKVAKQIG